MGVAPKDRRLDHELEVHGGAAGWRRGQDGVILIKQRKTWDARAAGPCVGKVRSHHL